MRVVLVLSLVVAAACAPSGPPTREPDIVGLITIVSDAGHTILVEERPQETSGSAKARILVTEQTRIWRLGSPITTATWSDLRVGTGVRAWFDGAVETSYPLGAKGAAIAIDPSAAAPSLYVLSKGAPAVIVTVNGFDAAHVECNGGAAIRPGADLTPRLPWEVVVTLRSSGLLLLNERVADLPRWLLVTPTAADISSAPVLGPFAPCP